MEERKENVVDQANFNDLPNELLWNIFHHLGHSDLLQMTLVSRRWNQVIFHFLNDRFRFRPEACDGLYEHRIYRHLDLSMCPLPLPDQGLAWRDYHDPVTRTQLERQNVDAVRSIKIKTRDLQLELMVRLMMTFKNLASLDLDVRGSVMPGFILNGKTWQIKHLKIKARIAVLHHVLQYLSRGLVSLHLVFWRYTPYNHWDERDNFPSLETLKVELYGFDRSYDVGSLTVFLDILQKLRKLSFKTCFIDLFEKITAAIINIEELELLGIYGYYIPDMSKIKNLKIFRSDARFLHFDTSDLQPMAQVTTLDIDQAINVDFGGLAKHFPNLTALYMASMPILHTDLTTLSTAYPALQVLSIRLEENFSITLALISVEFADLIELRVNILPPFCEHDRELAVGNLSIFGGILAKPTLQKLYIKTKMLPQFILPRKSTNCRVFVNGVLV